MHLLARARVELARRPWVRWLAVAVLAVAAAWSTAGALRDVERARAAWGESVDVVVTTRAIAPGDALAGATRRRAFPVAIVPERAVAAVGDDAVARQHIGVGEIVTDGDVSIGSGLAALAPVGTHVLAVIEPTPLPVALGDRVVVTSGGVELVADAVVVGRVDGAVLLAVRSDRAAMVAAAAGAREVDLLLVP